MQLILATVVFSVALITDAAGDIVTPDNSEENKNTSVIKISWELYMRKYNLQHVYILLHTMLQLSYDF